MNKDYWTLTEFKAYLLLFAAHSNFVETATERDYILSKIDSKIIIDKNGAESLLGKGDALIKIPSEEHLIRLQVPYLDTLTTSNVCKLWGE